MGLAMSPLQLLIILVIVAVIFGTKRLRDVGGDLGSAVKSFRKAMNTTGDADESVEAAQAARARRAREHQVNSVRFPTYAGA